MIRNRIQVIWAILTALQCISLAQHHYKDDHAEDEDPSAEDTSDTGFVSPDEFKSIFDFTSAASESRGFNGNNKFFLPQVKPAKFEKIKNTQRPFEDKEAEDDEKQENVEETDENSSYDDTAISSNVFTSDFGTASESPTSLNILSAKPQYYPADKDNDDTENFESTVTPYRKYSFQSSDTQTSLPTQHFFKKFPAPKEFLSFKEYPLLPRIKESTNEKTVLVRPKDAERIPRKICRQIEKDLPPEGFIYNDNQDLPMTCFICKDSKSKEMYEQCSYTSQPNSKEYYKKYTTASSNQYPTVVSNYRYKRYARKAKHDDNDYDTKHPNYKYKSKPYEFDTSETYASPNFSDLHLEHDDEEEDDNHYSFDPIVQSYNNQQKDQIQKEGGDCREVERDSMTCTICKNPKTGGDFEQCSYRSEPNENKYAFSKSNQYNSNDEPSEDEEEEEEQDGTRPRPVYNPAHNRRKPQNEICHDVQRKSTLCRVCKNRKTGAKSENCSYRLKPHPEKYAYRNERKFRNKPYDEYTPPNYDDEYTEQSQYSPVVQRAKTRKPNSAEKKDQSSEERTSHEYPDMSHEQYLAHFFPDYDHEESVHHPHVSATSDHSVEAHGFKHPEDFFADDSQINVEKVLAEFETKDRSNCEKIHRGKLTCYKCIDAKGAKNEECMYSTESAPRKVRKAYRHRKKYRSTPEATLDSLAAATSATKITSPEQSQPKITTYRPPFKQIPSTSQTHYVYVEAPPNLEGAGSTVSEKQEASSDNEQLEPVPPEVEGSDGAFASELKPIYSPQLGLTLPAFMLTKSEHEVLFDEVVASG